MIADERTPLSRQWFRTLVCAARSYGMILCVTSAIACGIDREGVAPAIESSQLLRSVQMEYRAYSLSKVEPYDTVSLNVRGLSGTGEMLDAPVAFQYDSRYITIDDNGLLQAVSAISSTKVIATMSYNGSTRADTALVSVINDTPRHLARVAIELNPGDSAKNILNGVVRFNKTLRLIRADSNNGTVSSALVSLWSSNPAVATILQSGNNINVTTVQPGETVFHVAAYAYGEGYRDSLSFTVGWPLMAFLNLYSRYPTGSLTPVLSLTIADVTVGVGACVAWQNPNDDLDMEIIFDDPTYILPPDSATSLAKTICTLYGGDDTSSAGKWNGGNLAPWRRIRDETGRIDLNSYRRSRAFTRPGIYTFRNPRYEIVGTIVVCDERNDPTCAPGNKRQ